jgi:hypothetical protein
VTLGVNRRVLLHVRGSNLIATVCCLNFYHRLLSDDFPGAHRCVQEPIWCYSRRWPALRYQETSREAVRAMFDDETLTAFTIKISLLRRKDRVSEVR